MTVTPAFCPLSLTPLLDRNGYPIRGGMIYAYDAETTNPRTVYQDPGLTVAYPFPVKTDAFGRIPKLYLGIGSYKIELHDAANALIDTIDDLPGGTQTFDAPATPSGWNTGDMKFAHTSDIQDGWVIANGKTIGNQNSAATARASADTQALFVKLWNADPTLSVSGTRGASATADFASGKTIATPDYRGRSAIGVDQMGAGLTAGIITTATTPTPDQVGTVIGAEGYALSLTQLPVFTPSVSVNIAAAGGHSHTGYTDSQGNHNHPLYDPGHSHPYSSAYSFGVGAGGGPALDALTNNTTGASTTGISLGNAGAHMHAVTTAAVADHSHTATAVAASIGGGGKYSSMQPAVLGFWHIRL